MNRFENNHPEVVDKEEAKQRREEKALYQKVERDILAGNTNGRGYFFGHEAQRLVAKFVAASGKSATTVVLNILERFNNEQGALADALEENYVHLAFSPEAIKNKMADGREFYEAVAAIAKEIKGKGINLDKDLIDQAVAAAAAAAKSLEPVESV